MRRQSFLISWSKFQHYQSYSISLWTRLDGYITTQIFKKAANLSLNTDKDWALQHFLFFDLLHNYTKNREKFYR